jgi:hypothetical protein
VSELAGAGSWAGGWDEPGVLSIVLIQAGTAGSGLFVYSGVPAAGNLIYSITAANGKDLFGNATLAGAVSYTTVASGVQAVQVNAGVILWYHAATEAGPYTNIAEISVNQSLAGVVTFQVTGGDKTQLLTTADANVYNMARLDLPVNATGQTINSTSATTLNNCTANLASGVTYRFEGEVQFTANANAGNPSFQFAVSASTSALWMSGFIWQTSGSGAGANRFVADTSGAVMQGPGMVSGAVYIARMKGELVTTGAGAISLQAFTSNASDTFTINNGYMELLPNA